MYIWIENDKINGAGEEKQSNVINYIPSEELYNDFKTLKTVEEQNAKYMWNGTDVVLNPDYEEMQANKRREQFNKDFFNTSLGWVRRKPTLADGTEDDFLNNDLPLLAIGLMNGSNPVLPIAYQLPDFTHEFTKEYMESLQVKNQPITKQFIAECSAVKMRDFTG